MRCASPPDSVDENRSRVRYSQADIVQKLAALPDLVEYCGRRFPSLPGSAATARKIACLRDIHAGHLRDIAVAEPHPQCLRTQARAADKQDTPCKRDTGS